MCHVRLMFHGPGMVIVGLVTVIYRVDEYIFKS
jgi:hypothetical protein